MKRRRILAVLILLLSLFLGGYMIFTGSQLAKIYREYPPEVTHETTQNSVSGAQ